MAINNTVQPKPTWSLNIPPANSIKTGALGGTQTSTFNGVKAAAPLMPTPPMQGPIQGPIQSSGTQTQYQAPAAQQPSYNDQLNSIKAQALNIQSQIPTATTPSATRGLVQPPAPQKNTLGGILPEVIRASTPTGTQTGLIQNLSQTAANNQDQLKAAQDIRALYGGQIAEVGRLGAGARAGSMSTGSNIVGAGNAAIASQSASARMSALAAGQQAELSGVDRELAAQGQTAGAYGQALTGANTQQGQQISGLTGAAGLTQPVQVPYGSQYINPATGESAGGAGLGGYAGYNAAQQAISLGGQYPDSGFQYNPSMTPEQNLQAAQQAIQGSPTYQKGTYGTPGQQSVAGATQVQAAQQGYTQSQNEYVALRTSYLNADRLADNALNIMKSSGINPTDVKFANQKISAIKSQLSSENQQRYNTAIQEAANAFKGLVASYGGQTPTEVGNAYNQLLDSNASLGAVTAAIDQLRFAGTTRMQEMYGQAQTYYSQLPQGGAGGGSSDTNFNW